MNGTQLLNTQMNAEEIKEELKESYDKLVHYEKIDNTPFTMVIREGKYFVVLGNNMLTKLHNKWEEAIEELEREKWNIILNIAVIVQTKLMNDKELEKLPI